MTDLNHWLNYLMPFKKNKKEGDTTAGVDTLVRHILDKDVCKNVFILAGAGISTSAGIPDFRSPKTGLYANLARLNLPYPEAVFDIGFFEERPEPFYALAKELEPGKFRPTITHSFIRLLHEKGLLHTCFTQNIDTLERRAGVPVERLIEAHGSFATHSCIKCGASYPDDKMRECVAVQRIPRCSKCKGLVKPNIVFFGESLPTSFGKAVPSLRTADLLIILGTSLSVFPFASLTYYVPKSCPRVLINLDKVGDIGSREKDILLLGDCDTVVRQLCTKLGWGDELEALWEVTGDLVERDSEAESKGKSLATTEESKDEKLSREVEALTKEVEKTLKISEEHVKVVNLELAESSNTGETPLRETVKDSDEKLGNRSEVPKTESDDQTDTPENAGTVADYENPGTILDKTNL
ncbi:Sir2 family transcription regulator [Cantharellus anzutake]|uniref:Sir2 family transcription regulator n=1 Tax=Cantharellus anzutake TaxID=1750568 RepID=UPI0019069F6C|nr:Sir2 family transcription regulator [Cantharellus anzutake]KAF8343010.1 Sir2 family transcription regulator [Cantharellus anzutake]